MSDLQDNQPLPDDGIRRRGPGLLATAAVAEERSSNNPLNGSAHHADGHASSSASSSDRQTGGGRASTAITARAANLFTRAMHSGSSKGRELLHDTYRMGQGIGHENVVEVVSKVQRETLDPLISAVHGLYAGSDLATVPAERMQRELQTAMARAADNKMREKVKEGDQDTPSTKERDMEAIDHIVQHAIASEDDDDAKVRERELFVLAVDYANGELPGGGALLEVEDEATEKQGRLMKALKLPLRVANKIAMWVATDCSKKIAKLGNHMVYPFLLYFMTYVIVPTVMGPIVPLSVFYLAVLFMVIGTLQQVRFQKLFSLYHMFSETFLQLRPDLEVARYEGQYIRKHAVTSPLVFFSAFVVMAGLRQVAAGIGVWSEPILLASVGMGLLLFFTASSNLDEGLVWLSLGLRLAALITSQACSSGVLSGLVVEGAVCPWGEVHVPGTPVALAIGVESMLLFAATVLLLMAGLAVGVAGWLQAVLPHLMCLAWLDAVRFFQPLCTWEGFAGIVSVATALVFSPVQAVYWLMVTGYAYRVGLLPVMLLLSVVGASYFAATRTDKPGLWRHFQGTSGRMQAVIVAVALTASALLSLVGHINSGTASPGKKVMGVSWQHYAERCLTDSSTVAVRQLACMHINQQRVEWSGTVVNARVAAIDNVIHSSLSSLPMGIGYYVYQRAFASSATCSSDDASDDMECQLQDMAMSALQRLNKYTFSLTVEMAEPNATLIVTVGHQLNQSIALIKPGVLIRFQATVRDAGSDHGPSLKAKKVVVMRTDNGVPVKIHSVNSGGLTSTQEVNRAITEVFKAVLGGVTRIENVAEKEEEKEAADEDDPETTV